MTNLKNVIIIGLGSIGLKHFKLIQREFKNINLIIFKNSKKKINNNKNITLINKYDDLKNIQLFAAIICTPSNTHIKYAKKISYFTKRIFIEKPISNKYSKSFEFMNFAKKNNLIVHVGYNLLFDPLIKNLYNLIQKKNHSDILFVNIEAQSFLPSWRKNTNYKQFASAQKNLGGGVLLELSHEINYILKIFGKIKSVFAIIKNSKTLDIDVEDFAEILMQNNSKTIFRIHLNFNSKKNIRKCEIITNKETIEANLLKRHILMFNNYNKLKKIKYNTTISDTYKFQFDEFLNKIKKNNNLNSLMLGVDTLKIIEAVKLSSKIKNKVFIK